MTTTITDASLPAPAFTTVAHLCWHVLAAIAYLFLPCLMACAWIAYMATQNDVVLYWPGAITAVLGISCIYALDRFLDPDHRSEAFQLGVHRKLCAVAAIVYGIAAVVYSLLYNQEQWFLIIVCGLLCAVHAVTKKIPLAKTFMISLCWFCACCLLPFALEETKIGMTILVHVALWFTVFALSCVLCDLKDVDRDRDDGICSLPVLMGITRSRHLVLMGLLLLLIVTGVLHMWALSILCVLLAVLSAARQLVLHPLLAVAAIDGALTLSAGLGVYVF